MKKRSRKRAGGGSGGGIEADMPEGTKRTILASKILEEIQNQETIEYDDFIIEGDLDISKLDLPIQHVERTKYQNAKQVTSVIRISNSCIYGTLNFQNTIFIKPIYFSNTKFCKGADFSL